MKKCLFILSAGIILLSSCGGNESGGLSATAKKNMEVNQAIMKAYEAGDFSKMGDYIAADAVDHAGETGDIKGLDNIVAAMKQWRGMMKDTKTETVREMADDEYVMTWSKFSGTLTADGMGMKAGDVMNTTSIDVSKFKDGKATEHWMFMDGAEMNKMMAAMSGGSQMPPPPPPDMKKDTAAMKK